MASLIYMGLSAWEPASSRDTDFTLELWVIKFDVVILVLFSLDALLYFIHTWPNIDRGPLLRNMKFMLKIFFLLLLILDAIYFYSMFPQTALRFARYVRPCNFYLLISHDFVLQ
jgi:hypothetical protein